MQDTNLQTKIKASIKTYGPSIAKGMASVVSLPAAGWFLGAYIGEKQPSSIDVDKRYITLFTATTSSFLGFVLNYSVDYATSPCEVFNDNYKIKEIRISYFSKEQDDFYSRISHLTNIRIARNILFEESIDCSAYEKSLQTKIKITPSSDYSCFWTIDNGVSLETLAQTEIITPQSSKYKKNDYSYSDLDLTSVMKQRCQSYWQENKANLVPSSIQ